jgi:phosphate-selective porin OprO/OprP
VFHRSVRFFLFALALLFAPPVFAGEALLKLIDALHEQGTIDDATHAAIRKAAEEEAQAAAEPAGDPERAEGKEAAEAGQTEIAKEEAGEAEPKTHVRMGTKGLQVETEDGFAVALGGRLHVDSAWYDDDEVDLGNGSEIRRLRAEVEGVIWDDYEFKAAIDFAGDGVSVKSTYITYTGLDWFDIVVGRYKEPFGLEELGSSNDTLLMERAGLEVFAPQRHIGAGLETHGDQWTAAWGAFVGDDEFLGDDGGDTGWSTTGRVTVAPLLDERRVLHFGTAGSYKAFDSDEIYTLDIRPESHVTDVRFVETGDILEVHDVLRWGGEAAALLGPVTLQSEYVRNWVDRRDDSDLAFEGYYVLAAWVLTGEGHEYRASRGLIGEVIPRHNAGRNGFGAWEVAARYSVVDLADDDVRGGEQSILGFGLNWYLNPNLRMMFNYLHVLDVKNSGEGFDGETPDVYQMRAQLDF